MTSNLSKLMLGLACVSFGGMLEPAAAQTSAEKPRSEQTTRSADRDRKSGGMTDGWITMKVHSQFIPEDALEGSDIDVDTNNGVVTLTGTVATEAGRARAAAIARATDGVKSVTNNLRIAPEGARAGDMDRAAGRTGAAAREAGRETGAAAREAGRETGEAAREAGRETGAAAREAGRDTKAAARGAGRTVNDGWIKSKIYAQFLTEDALNDSDIDIDVANGVVTLNGTVVSDAGRTRAEALAKATDGVKRVNNSLKATGRRQ